jgi:uracil-DNA glycosylase family 4
MVVTPLYPSWEATYEAAATCHACALGSTRTHCVFSSHAQSPVLLPTTPLLLVGEAPGAEEDACGQPFVGRSGQLLMRLLAEQGLQRNEAYTITNTVKCRPPNNRKPTTAELAACAPLLQSQVAHMAPKALLLVGACAAACVLGLKQPLKQPLGQLRGQWHTSPPELGSLPTLVTFHPAYLLRNPRLGEGSPTAMVQEDLRTMAQFLKTFRL